MGKLMNLPYSHKYEIADYLQLVIDGWEEKAQDVLQIPSVIRDSQTFRIADKDVLPQIKDYKAFYEFMKPPYRHALLELPVNGGWLVYSVNDYLEEMECLGCMVFYKKAGEQFELWGDLIVNMDEDGYEVTTKLKWVGEDENRRFAWTIFEFFVAINTPNIKQIEIKPPKSINAKRKKKGKALLAGYHYLDLSQPYAVSESTGIGSKKRTHWRRGHIRRLADKAVWVRPALIGNGEFVDKTYRLTRHP